MGLDLFEKVPSIESGKRSKNLNFDKKGTWQKVKIKVAIKIKSRYQKVSPKNLYFEL